MNKLVYLLLVIGYGNYQYLYYISNVEIFYQNIQYSNLFSKRKKKDLNPKTRKKQQKKRKKTKQE